jgi:nucleoid-associated protein YgaU
MLLLTVLLLVATGCSKKTPQQVIDVNQEMAQAKDNCAGVYAADYLQSLQRDVDEMNALVDDKKMKKAAKEADEAMPQVQGLNKQSQETRDKAKADAEAAIKKAEEALDGARQAEAPTLNASGFKQAESKLGEAKNAMMDPCKYYDARKLAEDAARQADNARQAAIAEKKRIEDERRRAEEERRRKEEEARLEEERRKKMFPASYVVEKGDYLWRISGMETIYKNPIFWPLIFDANTGQIQDPDLIYPGQELTIPRDMSDQEMMDKLYRAWATY